MLKLLNTEDANVIGNSSFAKNAILYKDLIAFCEAYRHILEHESELPNFCFSEKNKVCIEGICFLMKMYATEFKFETMKLTLDYLKILYFTMASYADENGEVDQTQIEQEFHEYRIAGAKFCDERKDEVKHKATQVKELESTIKKQSMKSVNMKKNSKLCKILAIVILGLSLLGISLSLIAMFNTSVYSPLFLTSVICTVSGFIISIILLFRSKFLLNHSGDVSYHVQTLKKDLTNHNEELNLIESKYYRVFCEKNEYAVCFAELIAKFSKILNIDEILKRSNEYRLLSYNVPYDIGRLFKTQQSKINDIIESIEEITLASNDRQSLSNLYLEIKDQDWLYFNAEVRYHFLKKFSDFAEKDFDWKLNVNGEAINPFDINVKDLSREKIAFCNDGKKFIISNLADFTKTTYFKNLDDMSFKDGFSIDLLKKVKSNYLSHFYNANVVENENQASFENKDNKNNKDNQISPSWFERIPTLINLKLKIIESDTGLGNSDTKTIKNIAESIFSEEKQLSSESLVIKEDDVDYPKFTANKTEVVEDAIVYYVGNTKKIGYKVD